MNKIYKIIIYKIVWTDNPVFGQSDWMTADEFYKVYSIINKPSMFGNKNFSIRVLTKESD